jgi:hypothetical protein
MLLNTTLNIAAREPHVADGDEVTLHPYSLVLLRFGRERRVPLDAAARAEPVAVERRG